MIFRPGKRSRVPSKIKCWRAIVVSSGLPHRQVWILQGERGEGGEAVRTRSAQLGQFFVLDLDDLGGGVAVLAIPEWVDGENLHVDRLSIHALEALLDDNEVLLRASGLRYHPAGLVAHQGIGFAEAAMCVHVNGLDSLAVDHHWQALSAALLSPRRIPQPTTAENDTGRCAGTL